MGLRRSGLGVVIVVHVVLGQVGQSKHSRIGNPRRYLCSAAVTAVLLIWLEAAQSQKFSAQCRMRTRIKLRPVASKPAERYSEVACSFEVSTSRCSVPIPS